MLFSILYYEDMLFVLSQVYFWRYKGKNIIIYTNMDVILFRTFSHMIIGHMESGSTHRERGRILIKESSIKVINARQNSGKAQLIFWIQVWNIRRRGKESNFIFERVQEAQMTRSLIIICKKILKLRVKNITEDLIRTKSVQIKKQEID